MRSAELARERELVIVDIDGDDGIGGNHGRALDHVETYAAAAENSYGLAYFELGQIIDEAQRGSDSAAHEGGNFKGDIFADGCEAVFRDDGTFIESSDPSRINGAAVPKVLRAAGLDTGALAPVEDDVISLAQVSYAGSGFKDDATALVAQQVREEFILPFFAIDLAQLSAADAALANLHENLAAIEGWDFNVIHDQRRVEGFEYCGFGFHGRRLTRSR